MRISRDEILAALIKIGVHPDATFAAMSRGDLATALAEALNDDPPPLGQHRLTISYQYLEGEPLRRSGLVAGEFIPAGTHMLRIENGKAYLANPPAGFERAEYDRQQAVAMREQRPKLEIGQAVEWSPDLGMTWRRGHVLQIDPFANQVTILELGHWYQVAIRDVRPPQGVDPAQEGGDQTVYRVMSNGVPLGDFDNVTEANAAIAKANAAKNAKSMIIGTDQCDCTYPADAPYPACPHDIRGPKGEQGPTGGDKTVSFGRFGPANVPYEKRPKGTAELAAEQATTGMAFAELPCQACNYLGCSELNCPMCGVAYPDGAERIRRSNELSQARREAYETRKTLVVNDDPTSVDPSEADAMFKFFKGS